MDTRRRLAEDFDWFLDAPGPVSDRAMSVLLSFLGLDPAPDDEWWTTRVAAATASPLLPSALAHEDIEVRRLATCVLCYARTAPATLDADDEPTRLGLAIVSGVHHGWRPDGDDVRRFGAAFGALLARRPTAGMHDALTAVLDEPGRLLTALPWAEPGWDTPANAVADLLDRAPEVRRPWLRAMADRGGPVLADEIADAAMYDGAVEFVEPYGLALLDRPDDDIRRRAIRRLSRWRQPAYQDAVAKLLPDPTALEVLADLADERCVPYLMDLADQGSERLRIGFRLGAELAPHVLDRLASPLPPAHTATLLQTAGAWGDPPIFERDEAADAVGRLTDLTDPDVVSALCEICLRLSMRRAMSDPMRARLRVLATGPSLRVRQYAQFALLEAGEREWLVPVLVREITEHPVRTGRAGPHNGTYGWRADATACAWLGCIGKDAVSALPVLSAMAAETGEAGEARADAAEAYERIAAD